MYRFSLLCILSLMTAPSLQAQSVTETGSVDIEISFIPVLPESKCSLETTSATLNFGTVTASRSASVTSTASTTARVKIESRTGATLRHLFTGSLYLSNGDSDRILMSHPENEVCSCSATGNNPRLNDTWVMASCTCNISATVTIPARIPPGTYTGSSTFTANCSG